MATMKWTMALEEAYQNLRRARGGEPFADPEMEEAYRAINRRRLHATPDEEVAEAQHAEEFGK